MRVRVELRRNAGVWIARFRKQMGVTGELTTVRKELQGRKILCTTMIVEPLQGFPNGRPPAPELFEARLNEGPPDQVRLIGWECVDLAWHVQEWDCFILPDRRSG